MDVLQIVLKATRVIQTIREIGSGFSRFRRHRLIFTRASTALTLIAAMDPTCE